MKFCLRTGPLLNWAAAALLMVAAVGAGPASAVPVQTPHTTAELVAADAAIAPGKPFQAAVKITPMKGWHTYWRNPGDSGMATTLDWSLPDGFSVGDIAWPAPEVMPYGPLINYGYDGEHWLLVTITPPESLKASSVTIRVRADWLVCEDICIPEGADLTLDLPVAGAPVRDPRQTSGFRKARAAVPAPFPGKAAFHVENGVLGLRLTGAPVGESPRFFPYDETLIRYEAPQTARPSGDGVVLAVPMGGGKTGDTVSGVIEGGGHAWEIKAVPGDFAVPAVAAQTPKPGGGSAASAPPGSAQAAGSLPVWKAALFAFVGGILLNLMPCVFPVLSLKALAVVKASGLSLRQKRTEGLLYAAGVVLSFLVLAGALLAFRAGGAAVGWGFQLQSPEMVALLAAILFTVGLSLSGYFELAGSFTGLGQGLIDRGGALGAFATGVLATVVATPCTAPFMATALGAAMLLPPAGALAIFLALGLGLAFPMLLISEIPAIGRLLPRPGPWMERFRQFLAFPVFATAVWLVTVLGQQAGIEAVAALLAVLLLIVFALWLWQVGGGAGGPGRAVARTLAVLALVAAGWLVWSTGAPGPAGGTTAGDAVAAEPFDPQTLASYRAAGDPVFVNFTAAWCITCLANERVALSSAAVAHRFREGAVKYLKGDWTRRDPEITRTLAAYGRSGVPLYLYFAPGSDEAVVLPQLLTPETVIGAMDKADAQARSG
ncbi:MAG: thiol:disulfide interchange protein [Alphaproteobacteria bacterium]|nr:thiol:disulfide interchange protein [Alphaproteobacteria bacterium]